MNSKERIEWKKCKSCGFLQSRTHLRCLVCKNNKFEVIEASGSCKLLAYTILKAPPAEFRSQNSYALGIVEFENRIKKLGQITSEENLKIGIKLKPIYRKIWDNLDGKEVWDHVFEPIG